MMDTADFLMLFGIGVVTGILGGIGGIAGYHVGEWWNRWKMRHK
jgi:hypothetical protein